MSDQENPAQEAENAELETQDQAIEGTVEPVEEEISQDDALLTENAQLKDDLIRAKADVQNVRRRAEQDVEKAHKFSTEKFARELLSVVDNLERAMASCPDEEIVKPFLEGVEMTQKSFLDTLKKFSVEAIDPEGHPFDPALHQAISMVEAPDAEPNTVLNVVQKGYTNHGRLLRPAMVVVSKAAPKVDEKA